MANWSTTTRHEPESINGGRRYELRDRVSIEQLNNMTENAFYAMDAAKTAKEKAEEALSFAQGSGTTVFENGEPVAQFNADKKADVEDVPTEYIKDASVENDTLTIKKANGLIISFQGGSGSGAVSSVNGKTGDVQLNANDVGALPSDTPLFSGNYNDLSNKPTIPTTASQVNALPNTTRYGSSIDLSIDSTTYVVTAQLKDQNGNNLGDAKTIDLPLESVVVSGSYDAINKKVILTLKDGSTIDFSVADLVSGLQTEITSSNKLSVTLIDGLSTIATSGSLSDATQDATHRTVTDTEKNTWNNKMDKVNPTGTGTFNLNGSGSEIGYRAVAIGNGAIAKGDYSFCEGWSNQANGKVSHAEGNVTRANGECSHSQGFYTFANGICQHTMGRSNIVDNENKYIEIVGNGDGYINDSGSLAGIRRSNARTLDWDGNEYLAGNLQAQGLTDGTTTKTMTEILTGGGGTNIIWREWT